MVLIGDVFATILAIFGFLAASWGLLVLCAVLFPFRTDVAKTRLSGNPWKCFGIGLSTWLVLGSAGIGLLNAPLPLVKLAGFVLLMGLVALTCIGSAGIARLMSDRISASDPSVVETATFNRASLALVFAEIFPVFGWFFVLPAVMCVGLGAGYYALRAKALAPQSQTASAF